MQTYAAIDIGSNSCRLKIARVVQHRLKVLHEDREVTRLGTSVFETGLVSPEAMATTLRALKRFQRATQVHGVDQTRAVATAAMRDARNAQAFLAWVKSETGWAVEIISGLEEARLIHRGVMNYERGTHGRVLLIDVGGGSCEISLSEQKRIKEMISLPLGAVRLTQEFLHADPPAADEVARMKQFIDRELRRAHRKIGPVRVGLVVATSGTAATLADASKLLARTGKTRSTPKSLAAVPKDHITPLRDVRQLTLKLTKLAHPERSSVPGVGPRRSEIIVAGAHVFSHLMESFSLTGFRYSDLGLRDGMLAQMLAEQDTRTSAHQQFERDRWESVLAIGRNYGVEARHTEPVRQHAAQLFRDLERVHGMPADYRQWLEAAAVLREVGKFVNHQGHHRHAQYIISNSELFGFTVQQRAIVSAIARYMGKSRPASDDRVMRTIPPGEHEHVCRAVAILRVAVALNQDRASDVLRVKVSVYPKRILLEIIPGRTGAELELWSLRKEADYFREVFRRDFFATLA